MKQLEQFLELAPTAVASERVGRLVLEVGWRASPIIGCKIWLEGQDARVCRTHLMFAARSVGALWQCFVS